MVTSSNYNSKPEEPEGEAAPNRNTMSSNSVPGGSNTSLQNIVPPCPQGLCINKADFLKPDFSVDNFFIEVSVREGGTSLDTLRDDLGIYLKVLRSSMIELINQDYADFVNLSTNLVGLDQGIIKIRDPLVGFSGDINKVKDEVSECLEKIRSKLARQEKIRQEKEMLGSLQQVAVTTTKVERMVGEGDLTTDTAERIATDINQLNFAVWKMKESKFIQQIEPRVTAVCDALNTWLDDTCLTSVRENNTSTLSRCLRIYATIDRVAAAEKLVREEIVKPQVEFCLSEKENVNSENLGQVCQSLLRIIPEHLAILIRLTTDTKKLVEGSVSGFNFLVNSYWPEVSESFLDSLNHVSSPGNPDEFFKNYNISMKFLDDFEMNIDSEENLNNIRTGDSYNNFLQMWNLPLYFQIRFHEIAKPVESLMIANVLEKGNVDCKLKVTEVVKSSISSCFTPEIYIPALAPRFLQLSLQILSRYKVWAEYCLKTFKSSPSQEMKKSETLKNLQSVDTSKKSLSKSASEKDLASVNTAPASLTINMMDLINISSDISHLIANISKLIILPSSSSIDISPAVSAAAAELSSLLPVLSEHISTNIAAGPIKSVKSVVDIPRMYRRTNRDTPSKPCNYITSVVESFTNFIKNYKEAGVSKSNLETWMNDAGEMVSGSYLVQVQDVLANVTKMEESLRKLKKVRERGGAAGGEKDKSGGLSDDDKIRLQLYLDVSFFLRELGGGNLGDMSRVLSGDSCNKIKLVVDEAVNSFVSDLKL